MSPCRFPRRTDHVFGQSRVRICWRIDKIYFRAQKIVCSLFKAGLVHKEKVPRAKLRNVIDQTQIQENTTLRERGGERRNISKLKEKEVRPNPHWTRAHKSFDVACVQCGHPHSHQQIPFACGALHVASRVPRPVWIGPKATAALVLPAMRRRRTGMTSLPGGHVAAEKDVVTSFFMPVSLLLLRIFQIFFCTIVAA